MIKGLLILIIAYLIGSIPFGYIITKLSTRKNIFEIGWKKNSGSNVFKNVGRWQGALTFLLDVSKGFLVVCIPFYLGYSPLFQAFCGILAVIGHNWSCFIGFKGGRGLATLIGVILFMSPLVLFISLIPCIIFAIIWTASVGTLLSLLTAIIFSISIKGYGIIGILVIIATIPIMIKRLSPIKDILKNPENRELIENRLVFDQDTIPPLRIKKKNK
jgi:glycerol-3-phosphate acyltransferase PlsY